MRTINTNGITYIEPVPGATAEWYYGISNDGDLYEAEESFRNGYPVSGNSLCLIHYPDGEIIWPVRKEAGTCSEKPVYLQDEIFILNVDFVSRTIRIFCFNCKSHQTEVKQTIPLDSVANCYNLKLHMAPLSLTRQGNEGLFEIIWPERVAFEMDPHESFFLRQENRLYFNKWYEEGEGPGYRCWEETVVRNLQGEIMETLPGDIRMMPNGEIWYLL